MPCARYIFGRYLCGITAIAAVATVLDAGRTLWAQATLLGSPTGSAEAKPSEPTRSKSSESRFGKSRSTTPGAEQPAQPAAEKSARDSAEKSPLPVAEKPGRSSFEKTAKTIGPPVGADGKLTFSFRYQPWQQVLDWFSEQAGLSLLMDSPPPGTFNYADTRTYTPTEALDVLNGVLLTKGYTLVRHGRMLVVVNLEDGIPPNLVPDVPLKELDQRGEYELIRVLFPVWNMSPEQAAAEVQPLLGPQGKVVTLPQAREIQVTETGGRLRTIRSIVNSVEQPESATAGMREFPLKYITFEAAMPTIRQMLGIPAEAYSTPDTSAQVTKSASAATGGVDKLLFRGTAQQATRLSEVLRLIDVPEAARGVNGAPQLEVYSITTADPETVVKMLVTMLHNDPSVVLTSDKEAGHIMAFATPPQQATIRATIDQMQKESRQVDVIPLASVDPQVAVVAINKLFGTSDEKPDPKAPRVDADLTTHSLLVRGTPGQVAQIRELLRKLGGSEEEGGVAPKSQQHVRLLPLSGPAARSAIAQIEQIWPSVRTNHIRVVTPSAAIPSYRPSDDGTTGAVPPGAAPATPPVDGSNDQLQQIWQNIMKDRPAPAPAKEPAKQPAKTAPDGAKLNQTLDRAARTEPTSVFRFAANGIVAEPAAATQVPTPGQNQPAAKSPTTTGGQPAATTAPAPNPQAPVAKQTPSATLSVHGAPVVIAPGPGGIMIASDDLEALDQLEDMLSSAAGKTASSGRIYAVFYLKYSKAPVIAEVLNAIFGGSSGGKDKGIIGDLATNALGEVGGGLMGDLLTGGSSTAASFTSGAVDIVPDARLNALIVHAKQTDLDTIEQLLKVLDQHSGPESVQAEAPPRPIPVYNMTASDMATIIQGLYQDRMAGPNSVMSPQEMMKMLKGGGQNTEQQLQKMSMAVDTHNNLLVVRAPDALFEQVKAMVAELDQSSSDSPVTTKFYQVKNTNSATLQRALAGLSNVKTSTTPATTTPQAGSTASSSSSNDEDSPEERMRRAMRRNWDMVQEMRRMQDRGGSEGGGERGGFDPRQFMGRGGFGRSRGGGGDGERGGRGGSDGRRGGD